MAIWVSGLTECSMRRWASWIRVTSSSARKLVPSSCSRRQIRILRPGGVFHHVDIMTEGHGAPKRTPTIAGRSRRAST